MAKEHPIDRVLAQEVNLRSLLDALDFSDEEVVEASKAQPRLFVDAVRFRIKIMRERTRVESLLAVTRSEVGGRYRAKRKEAGERATEGQVSEFLLRQPKVAELQEALSELESQEEFAKLLLEAYRMRRDALKVVADVIGAELFMAKMADGQSGLKQIKSQLTAKYPKGKK